PGARVVPGDGGNVWRAIDPGSRVVGRAGRLEADAPKWAAAVLGFEVEIDVLGQRGLAFTPLPEQPATVQDLSLVLPGGVTAEQVEAVLRREGRPLLGRVEGVGGDRGPNGAAGGRGGPWRCLFRDPARTLVDREVDAVIRRALTALEGELGVRRRTG